MLRELHIRNYVLIDSLDAEFPQGLVIVTGQTGAGKSILLGALSLLLGTKADAGVIGGGAQSCIVEGLFEVSDPEIKRILEEADIEWDEGRLLIRRVVYSTGRSRSFINDAPVQVGLLADISDSLVDIHSQHQSLLLNSHRFQLSLLDYFSGVDTSKISSIWGNLQKERAALSQAVEQLSRTDSDREYNQAQLDELLAAKLVDGELEELELEQKQLSNAQEIRENLESACAMFSGEYSDICSSLKDAERLLEKTQKFIPSLEELSQRLGSARIELEDIKASIEKAGLGVTVSQERLEVVEERLALIYRLLQKHKCRTVAELLEVQRGFEDALFDTDSLARKVEGLKNSIASLEKEYSEASLEIRSKRQGASKEFSKTIQDSIHYLELERATFSVELSPCTPGPYGEDAVSYMFSSTGDRPADVSKCASGGEISRIMLCLKTLMARYADMPTMVFDEIDTGVSGSTADKMGEMICTMGADRQVFVITHLPQVAAKGSAHYLVSKSEAEDGHIISNIHCLSEEERILEIARLLSGASITQAAIENAKSLLGY